MVNQNDILAALQNGEDPQEIANKFADMLNGAIKQKAEADAELAAKKAEEERLAKATANREAYAQKVIDVIFEMMEHCYPEEYDPDMRKVVTAAVVVEAMDQTVSDLKRIHNAFKGLEALMGDLEAKRPRAKVTVKEKAIDPLEAFLKANGLKN